MISAADLNVAERTMKVKSVNYCVSFVSTVWRGEVIMCCFNNVDNAMVNVFCSQTLGETDIYHLESLIKKNILLDNVL